MNEHAPVEIQIWADLTCPWCWIGHRRLQRALDRRRDRAVRLEWRPYQLQPDLPPEGIPWERMVEERFGGPEPAQFIFDHVTRLGADEGIEFRFDRIEREPNTALAHGFVLAARDDELEWDLAQRFFRAHFVEGQDLSDPKLLRSLAREVGVPDDVVRAVGRDGGMMEEVEDSQREAEQAGAQGVPFFLLDNRVALTGAQPAEVFVQAIDTTRTPARRRHHDRPYLVEGRSRYDDLPGDGG